MNKFYTVAITLITVLCTLSFAAPNLDEYPPWQSFEECELIGSSAGEEAWLAANLKSPTNPNGLTDWCNEGNPEPPGKQCENWPPGFEACRDACKQTFDTTVNNIIEDACTAQEDLMDDNKDCMCSAARQYWACGAECLEADPIDPLCEPACFATLGEKEEECWEAEGTGFIDLMWEQDEATWDALDQADQDFNSCFDGCCGDQ